MLMLLLNMRNSNIISYFENLIKNYKKKRDNMLRSAGRWSVCSLVKIKPSGNVKIYHGGKK